MGDHRTGGEEKINRLSFLCFFSRKQRRLKKKTKQRGGEKKDRTGGHEKARRGD